MTVLGCHRGAADQTKERAGTCSEKSTWSQTSFVCSRFSCGKFTVLFFACICCQATCNSLIADFDNVHGWTLPCWMLADDGCFLSSLVLNHNTRGSFCIQRLNLNSYFCVAQCYSHLLIHSPYLVRWLNLLWPLNLKMQTHGAEILQFNTVPTPNAVFPSLSIMLIDFTSLWHYWRLQCSWKVQHKKRDQGSRNQASLLEPAHRRSVKKCVHF